MLIDNILLFTKNKDVERLLNIATYFYKYNRVSYSVFKYIMNLPYEKNL